MSLFMSKGNLDVIFIIIIIIGVMPLTQKIFASHTLVNKYVIVIEVRLPNLQQCKTKPRALHQPLRWIQKNLENSLSKSWD